MCEVSPLIGFWHIIKNKLTCIYPLQTAVTYNLSLCKCHYSLLTQEWTTVPTTTVFTAVPVLHLAAVLPAASPLHFGYNWD